MVGSVRSPFFENDLSIKVKGISRCLSRTGNFILEIYHCSKLFNDPSLACSFPCECAYFKKFK